MLANVVSLFSALAASAGMLFGSLFPSLPAPAAPAPAEAQVISLVQAPDLQPFPGGLQAAEIQRRAGLFVPDRLVAAGLVRAVVRVTGQRPLLVLRGLRDDLSLAQVAEQTGHMPDEVLAEFNERLQAGLDRAVENGRLAESMVESRRDWYQQSARNMLVVPGMRPGFPGLHRLHTALIAAAAKVGEVDREQMRASLEACQTLEQILADSGHGGEEAVSLVMERVDQALDGFVERERLTAEQQQTWRAALESSLQDMLAAPGLHLAGTDCAP